MKIALIGYGRMGRAVEDIARERGHTITARIRRSDAAPGAGITQESMEGADVAIDFSSPEAALPNIRRTAALGIDTVVGTTGWQASSLQLRRIVEEGGIGLIHSPNFSVGVHLFLRLVRQAGSLANRVEEYDPHLVETHHRHKRDHPSGTALRAAEILLDEVDRKNRWEEVQAGTGTPAPQALQIAVARAGENPGVHVLGLDGVDDRIEIRHEARTRGGFARGAVAAAEWVHGRKGLFSMEDWLGEHLGSSESGSPGSPGGAGATARDDEEES
ncbi:MAG: 4-hydroxy-tetrahydrodipicolinate reductase [Gemmatimonadota bacterium]